MCYSTEVRTSNSYRGDACNIPRRGSRKDWFLMQPHHITLQDISLKRCTRCGAEKPVTTEYFSIRQNGRDGFQSVCKDCARVYYQANRARTLARVKAYQASHKSEIAQRDRVWYLTNREQVIARNRARYVAKKKSISIKARIYRQANKERMAAKDHAYYITNRENIREQDRAYYLANRDVIIEKSRAQYRANREKIKERIKAYRAANPEIVRISSHRRRARQRNAEGTHTIVDIQRQYERQRGKCYYCGIKVGHKYHVDHVVPLSRGGSDGPENLVIACRSCNETKHNKLPHEWPEGGRLL